MNDDKTTLPSSLTAGFPGGHSQTPGLPDAPPESYPRAFGNYTLLSPLARGGMGEVFLAKHGSVRGLEKHCVVKTLRPHLTDDREYTTRFIDEARIVVQLGHRNICHVFDVGTVGERYYLAMEYIAGKDLRAVSADVGAHDGQPAGSGKVVNPGLALHVVSETLEALDYAHRHIDAATGKPLLLVHRDVSPQNIMLSWEGEVKLIDFGLAASTLKMEQTSPNVVMGKLAYMAPEQVRGERVDGRADMFAVAVILYEMLVGERFYEGRSPYEIWGIAAQGGFRPRGWDRLDDAMKAILDKAFASSAANRHASCLDLREALMEYSHARNMHGDAPSLRRLMQQVYADEIAESRRNLVQLSSAQPRDVVVQKDVFTVSTEPTVSLARSPSSSMPLVKEGTEPTEMVVKAMFGPRRLPIAAAALVIVAGLLAVIGIAWVAHNNAHATPVAAFVPPDGATHLDLALRDAAHDAAAHDAARDGTAHDASAHDDAAHDGTAHDAVAHDGTAHDASTNATAHDGTAHDGTGHDATAHDGTAHDTRAHDTSAHDASANGHDASAAKAHDANVHDASGHDTTAAAAAKENDARVDDAAHDAAVAAAAVAAADVDEKAKAAAAHPKSWPDFIDDMAAKCPSEACYGDVKGHQHDYGGLSNAEFRNWVGRVKACMVTCGIKPN